MIKNDRQYRITQRAADGFRKALAQLGDRLPRDTDPRILQAEREATEILLADLLGELAEYELLGTCDVPDTDILERLQNLIEIGCEGSPPDAACVDRETLQELSDEIRRLRLRYAKLRELHSDLFAKVHRLEQKLTWKPIDTAPGDGTEVIIYSRGRQMVACWDADHEWWWDGHNSMRDPTHWLPRPEDPK